MKLKDKIKAKHPNGTFVAVWFDESIRPLHKAAKKILENMEGDIVPYDELHTTIIYSKVGNGLAELEQRELTLPLVVTELALFGPDNNFLVAKVSSPELEKLHDDMMTKYSFTYDFPKYEAHVTLAENASGVLPDIEPFELITKNLIVKPIAT